MLFIYLLATIQSYNYNNNLIEKMYKFLLSEIEYLDIANYSSIPTVLQNIGLALLSILIPLAIAILTDALQKKDK